jgi:hypothetical protein
MMVNAYKNFFNKIITGDETWCFAYDPETKRQSSEWVGETSPWLKKTETLKVVHQDKVDAEFCKGVMDCPLKRIQQVCPAVFCSQNFFLLHDNVPAHKASSVCQLLTPKMLQPFITPHTSDLSLPDNFLFPKLKIKLKQLHFADVAEIQEAITDKLKKVQKEEFSAAFQKLYNCAKACIYSNGVYFEFLKS